MKGSPIRIGELADQTVIKECSSSSSRPLRVVENTEIDRRDINEAPEILDGNKSENTIGRTILDQVERMREYVIPPEMDFRSNPSIDPMYMLSLNKPSLSKTYQIYGRIYYQTLEYQMNLQRLK